MPVLNHESKLSALADVRGLFMKPLGGLVFKAKLFKLDYDAAEQARKEIWSGSDREAKQRDRKRELYASGRAALVYETIDRGEGSQRFLAKLAVEDGELQAEGFADPQLEVPDYPDFTETAGSPDSY